MNYYRKRILILVPSLHGGGAERVLINLLEMLNYDKYEVTLCVVLGGGVLLKNVHPKVNKIILFPSNILTKGFFYIYRRFKIDFILKYILFRRIPQQYDVGISFIESVYSDLILLLGKKIHKKITVVHSSYKSYALRRKNAEGRFKLRIIRRLAQFDTIVAVAEEALGEFKEMFGDYGDMRVIYNPINKRDVLNKALSYKPDLSTDTTNLVAMGRLIPVKGYDRLIGACSQLKQSGRKFCLTILGEGDERSSLTALINELGLKDDIKLLGFVENPYPYISESDIYIMSSDSEGLPTALCEAMTLGKPVVVTNCSGCREIVNYGEYGVMTEQNEISLFTGIAAMIDDVSLRRKYAQASLKRSEIFDDKVAISRYEALFN